MKFDTRGGWNKKRRLRSGAALLLDSLWKKHNGVTFLAEFLGLHRQQLINWKIRGYVAPQHIGPLSRKLGVSPYALNYSFSSDFLGDTPDWKEVVKDCEMETDVEKRILKLPPPK